MVAELRPVVATGAGPISADPERVISSPDLQPGSVTLALIDVPNVTGSSMTGPVILIAASSPGAGWIRPTAEISFGGQSFATRSAAFKSVLGYAVTMLGDSAAELIDEQNAVDVQLIDDGQWLTSGDDEGLAAGANLAVLGDQLFQFGQALPLGDGRFRLSRLLTRPRWNRMGNFRPRRGRGVLPAELAHASTSLAADLGDWRDD